MTFKNEIIAAMCVAASIASSESAPDATEFQDNDHVNDYGIHIGKACFAALVSLLDNKGLALEALDARDNGGMKSAQAYQVIGALSLGAETEASDEEVMRALNYFSETDRFEEDFLPWPLPTPKDQDDA